MSNTKLPEVDERWTAFHIFNHGSQTESLIANVIGPLAESQLEQKNIEKWFFLHYWEGGPHIRFRVLNADEATRASIKAALEAFCAQLDPSETISREAYYANHNFDGEPVDVNELPWYEAGTVAVLPYRPEYGRYAGIHAMAVSETLFCLSSTLCTHMVRLTQEKLNARFGLALEMMLATALGLGLQPKELANFFIGYEQFWHGFGASVETEKQANQAFDQQQPSLLQKWQQIEALVQQKAKHPLLSPWLSGLATARKDIERLYTDQKIVPEAWGGDPNEQHDLTSVFRSLAFSHIHMTNNRLGLFPVQEFIAGRMLNKLTASLQTV